MRWTGRARRRALPGLAPLAGLALVGVVALAGCGKAESPATTTGGDQGVTADAGGDESPTSAGATENPGAPEVDPCALVTKQEAEALAGTPLEDAVASPGRCAYTGPVTGPTAQVEVYVGPGAKKQLDIDRELGKELRPLPGIGDEAYIEDFTVFFVKSGLWVSIRLVRLEDPTAYDQPLRDLAQTAAGRF
ncbi:MAG: DUF3558 family protein [Micromonosporaceae bacterium]